MFGFITLRGGAMISPDALAWRFSRSSGPGGQSVNTADSRVELSVRLTDVAWSSPVQLERVRVRLAGRLGDDEVLTVTASEHRSQLRNREAALARVRALLDEALAPPAPPRRATRASRSSRERRAQGERRRRAVKEMRRRPPAS
ncbi:alternative ribosome rescue aminoacyl-tRNA hydrolase ArfB [Cellulomonas sp. P22]|uniref:alternative ribosome rescue aminoacyl-tRNA hydrolase ArfB n=1 Tax=Cellulomonas sp. P22 TaxID=3373189 RepID=UPI0037A947C5